MSEQPPTPDTAETLARLEDQIAALHEELRRLGPGTTLPPTPADSPAPGSYAWVSALDVPARRRPQVPRLLLESLFLAAAAAAAAIADLDAIAIAGVMFSVWLLVTRNPTELLVLFAIIAVGVLMRGFRVRLRPDTTKAARRDT